MIFPRLCDPVTSVAFLLVVLSRSRYQASYPDAGLPSASSHQLSSLQREIVELPSAMLNFCFFLFPARLQVLMNFHVFVRVGFDWSKPINGIDDATQRCSAKGQRDGTVRVVSPCSSGQVACFLIVVAQAMFLPKRGPAPPGVSHPSFFASRKEPIARDGTSELDEPRLVSHPLQAQLALGFACITSSKSCLFSKPSDTASGVSSSYTTCCWTFLLHPRSLLSTT